MMRRAKPSGYGDSALDVILTDIDAMLRRRGRALSSEFKESLLPFIDSLDGTKEQQRRVEEVEQSGAITDRILDSDSAPVLEMTPRRSTPSLAFVRLSLSRISGTNGSTFSASNEPSSEAAE